MIENYITVNNVKYIREDIHTNTIECMRRRQEQELFGTKTLAELNPGDKFVYTNGASGIVYTKLADGESILNSAPPDGYCYVMHNKSFKLFVLPEALSVRPIEGN